MDATGISADAKMVTQRHLFNNRAKGNDFVQMAEDHRQLCLRTYLTKNYYV
jgi:hypothetical protein